jgi:glycosyltransferase involved in cell wall biosynthesis
MRIALVSPVLPPAGESGIGSATLHLGLGLAGLGHQVDVFTWLDGGHTGRRESIGGLRVTRLAAPRSAEVLEVAGALGLKWLRTALTRKRPRGFSGAARDIRGMLTGWALAASGALDDYDAIEAPEWGGGASCFTHRRVGGVKIARLHGSLYSHVVRYAPFFDMDPWEAAIASAVERRGVNAADLVIAPSTTIATEAKDWLGIDAVPVHLPNCIDLEFVDALRPESSESAREDVVRVAFVGRLDSVKGAHVLDEMLRRVRRRPGSVRWEFHVAGDLTGARQFSQLQRVEDPNVIVYLHGSLGVTDVLRLLWMCDILFFPSQAENCPMTVLEAMACGTAVVGSGVGGVPELLPDDGLGLLCASDDVDGFETSLRALCDCRLRAQLALGARDRLERRYSSQIVGARWIRLAGTRG